MTSEKIIADRILGKTDDKTADRQLTCNIAASTKMVCSCGSILDQESVEILQQEVEDKWRCVSVLCGFCKPSRESSIADAAKTIGKPFRWLNWKGSVGING